MESMELKVGRGRGDFRAAAAFSIDDVGRRGDGGRGGIGNGRGIGSGVESWRDDVDVLLR